jgi:hypothetical protein
MSFTEIDNILDQLKINLLSWVKEVHTLFEKVSMRLTASLSWGLINTQLKRKIEKWYLLVQDAMDDVELVLYEQGESQITPEIEKYIRDKFSPVLKDFQDAGKELITKYQHISANLEPDIWQELCDILLEITVDNILNILKETFRD